jgi:hypothetical protein
MSPPGKKLSRKDMRMLRYGNLCNDFAKIVVDFAVSEKTTEIADKHMNAMLKELAVMKKAAADASNRKKKGKSTETYVFVLDTDMADAMDTEKAARLTANKEALDPRVTTTKGRLVQKRKRSGLQLKKPKAHPTK